MKRKNKRSTCFDDDVVKPIVVTKDDIIKDTAKNCLEIMNVRTLENAYWLMGEIYKSFENVVFDKLASVPKDKPIKVKLMNGVSLICTYVPERMFDSNLTGKAIAKDKVKIEADITRPLKEKIKREFDFRHEE